MLCYVGCIAYFCLFCRECKQTVKNLTFQKGSNEGKKMSENANYSGNSYHNAPVPVRSPSGTCPASRKSCRLPRFAHNEHCGE